jgi:hypothetical protein
MNLTHFFDGGRCGSSFPPALALALKAVGAKSAAARAVRDGSANDVLAGTDDDSQRRHR